VGRFLSYRNNVLTFLKHLFQKQLLYTDVSLRILFTCRVVSVYVRTRENALKVKGDVVITSANRFIKSSLFTFNSAQIINGISECLFVD